MKKNPTLDILYKQIVDEPWEDAFYARYGITPAELDAMDEDEFITFAQDQLADQWNGDREAIKDLYHSIQQNPQHWMVDTATKVFQYHTARRRYLIGLATRWAVALTVLALGIWGASALF